MIKRIEKLIIESPVYNFLRFNILSESLMEALQKKTQKNISYYSSFLKPNQNKLIFDIGANKGNKIKAFLKMGYKVIAVEPEKSSLETLNFRYKNKNVIIVPKGLSDKDGTEVLHITTARSGL